MTVVFLRSEYICYCSSIAKGRPLPSDKPLKSVIPGGSTLSLCHCCRANDMRHNYRPHGEIISCVDGYNTVSGRKQDVTLGLVAITTLIPIYAIIKSDPETIGVGAVVTELHHTTTPTELFDRAQVQDFTKRIHGVWDSIDAACTPKK